MILRCYFHLPKREEMEAEVQSSKFISEAKSAFTETLLNIETLEADLLQVKRRVSEHLRSLENYAQASNADLSQSARDLSHVPDVKLDAFQSHANGLRRIWSWMMTEDLDMQAPESEDPLDTADLIEAQAAKITALEVEVARLNSYVERLWSERNIAYAKVKGWEGIVYVEGLPLRSVTVDEFGPNEGETTFVTEVTPSRLTDLLDELDRLREKRRPEVR